MTAPERLPTKYLSREDIELIHSIVSKQWKEDGEPVPPFSTADEHNLDALIKSPQTVYFGVEQYPTLESKAAIIFYTLNKKHLFLNGNKRMSVACLIIFLLINNQELNVSPNDMTQKALELAKTTHDDKFSDVKKELEEWIERNLKSVKFEAEK